MPPRIVTARSMGLKFRPNRLAPMGPEKSVVGHYSAGARAKNRAQGIARAKSFHNTHLGKGWAGIAYHYVIADDGTIICCRSTFHLGAHVLNKNSPGRIGVNMPGTTGDRPTKRQARAYSWLLHNAHTNAMPRAHRTDRDLSNLPLLGHKDLMSTLCPGLFRGMYRRGGDPWIEPASGDVDPGLVFADPGFDLDPIPSADAPDQGFDPTLVDDGFAELEPEDEELLAVLDSGPDLAPVADDTFGPDAVELEGGGADEVLELPPEDPEFDEDLTDVLAEIEATPEFRQA